MKGLCPLRRMGALHKSNHQPRLEIALYKKIEAMQHYARIVLAIRQLGVTRSLTLDDRKKAG
jgi:hypothetical protein